ncbi:CBS domain-containing protein [Candidatus Nitronereus thalassa]|uniref:CBS domain-containing protein n=1 Tax=Candidatus Nitronereus thalassa TaxID=3020898 RepID=A0ABU3K8R7_9BACT|nr:CBS domain-containing protein [Candidatus Nitronereus thalassa]MDT7042807.1 CBS domain-containing protein [Candidatus Nitronereus thalassa]
MDDSLLNTKVREMMTTRMVAATRDYNARDLAVLLQSGTFSGIPILESGNKLVGLVTEFDVLKAMVDGKDLQALKAEDLMSSNPVSVNEHQTAKDAMTLMIAHKVIRLPVVRDGKLIGLIARTDIIDRLVDPHLVNVYGAFA